MPGASEIKAGDAYIEIGAKMSARFNRTLGKVRTRLNRFSKAMATRMIRMGKIAGIVAGVAATLAVRKAIREFSNLETKVTEVGTLLKRFGKGAFESIKREAQALAMQFGQTTDAMLGAKYDVVSAGFIDAADSANILRISTKAATAGLVDAKTATSLIISGLRGYQLEASEAERVSDALFTTVRLGRTTFGELAAFMGTVMPTAKAAGVSLEELGAALATVTLGGIDTATAVTSLNRMFLSMSAPSDQAKKAMKRMGIVTKDSAGNLLKLQDIIKQFQGKKLADVMELSGDIRSARGVLALANNFGIFKDQLKEFQNTAGATQTAFQRMANTLGFQMKKLSATWSVLFQDMGEAIAPALRKVVERMTAFFQTNRERIKAFIKDTWDNLIEKIKSVGAAISESMASGQMDRWIQHMLTGLSGVVMVMEVVVGLFKAMAAGILYALGSAKELIKLTNLVPTSVLKAAELTGSPAASAVLAMRKKAGTDELFPTGGSEEFSSANKLGPTFAELLVNPISKALDRQLAINKFTPFKNFSDKMKSSKTDPLSKRFGELAVGFVGKIDKGMAKLRDFAGFNYQAPGAPGPGTPPPGPAALSGASFGSVGASALSGASTAQLNRLSAGMVDEKTTLLREIRDSLVGRQTVAVPA